MRPLFKKIFVAVLTTFLPITEMITRLGSSLPGSVQAYGPWGHTCEKIIEKTKHLSILLTFGFSRTLTSL